MSPDLNESKPFCSPQDQIQWGILFLSRHLRGSSPWDRSNVCRMYGSGRGSEETYCACRLSETTGSATKRAGQATGDTKIGF